MLPSGIIEVLAPGEVEVVDAERLLEHGGVLLLGERQHRLTVVEHVVAPHLVRAVGETVRVLVVGRGQQQLGAVRRATGDDDDVAVERLLVVRRCLTTTSVTSVPGIVGLQADRLGAGEERHVRVLDAGRTLITSASDLACTRHGKPSQFWQRTHLLNGMLASSSRIPHGAWNGCRPAAGEVVGELLDPRLVGDRRERIRRARRRLGGILAAGAVHLVELLRLRVVRLQLLVGDRPRGRDTVVVAELAEVLLRGAGTGRRRTASSRRPRSSAPGAGTTSRPRSTTCPARRSGRRRTRPAASQFCGSRGSQPPRSSSRIALARRRQPVDQGPAAGAAADHDHVVW